MCSPLIQDSIEKESSLHRLIQRGDSEETINSLLKRIPYLVDANTPLQLLHQKYFNTVFCQAFHHENKVTSILHDEWFINDSDWCFISRIASMIILKGTLSDKVKGDRKAWNYIRSNSLVVHAALKMDECPIDVIRLLVASPWKTAGIDSKDHEGNLALHLSIDLMSSKVKNGASQEILKQCESLIIDLLDMYPMSVRVPNNTGQYPLTKLLEVNPFAYTQYNCTRIFDCIKLPSVEVIAQTLHCGNADCKGDRLIFSLLSLGATSRKTSMMYQIFREAPWLLLDLELIVSSGHGELFTH